MYTHCTQYSNFRQTKKEFETFKKFNVSSHTLYSIKEIYRTLVQRNVHFIITLRNFQIWSLDHPQYFQWRRMSQQIFFSPPHAVKCEEITGGIEFRPPYTFSLEEKKEKTGGNPSASDVSLCISLLFVISVETILRFSPQIHLFFRENTLFRLV